VKFFSDAEKAELTQRLKIEEGDIIFFAAAGWEKACAILGRLRLDSAGLLQKRGKLTVRHDDWKFLWVVDFPLMSYDEAENRYVATHHPFTAPVAEDAALLESNPKAVRGQHYDVAPQRHGTGRWLNPHPPTRAAEKSVRGRFENSG
jgi:aspartyl-tRNA synthetase